MIESLAIYLLVGSLCFGLGYACGTHSTWLPALGGKIKSGVGGLFSRKVVAPSTTARIDAQAAFDHANNVNDRLEEIASKVRAEAPLPAPVTPPTQPLWFMQPPGDTK
jgi:hypothetical protein